jgi:restriction endonuclease
MAGSSKDALRLPWTGEFSPGQLGDRALEETLAIVQAGSGNREKIVEAIRQRWFAQSAEARSDPAERLKQQRTRAGNVLNGMQNYGLVSDSYRLTDIGLELQNETDGARRSERFVSSLLKHRRGLELVDLVRDLQQRDIIVTNNEVREELRRRGYWVTVNDGSPGKLRQWLATSGVFGDGWEIDDARIAQLTGTSITTIGEWQSLTKVQRIFLATVRRLSETRGKSQIPSPELVDFVREEYGSIPNEGQIKRVYEALAKEGWIQHTVKQGGRGGKGGTIAATDKLTDVDFELLVGFKPGDLPADLRAAMAQPLATVYEDLKSDDTYTKGIALEVLSAKLASDLGLIPIRLRIRGVRTGGAEVDLVAEGAHLQFGRWLFQCKNTRSVDVGVLAKEVGMATLLQAQVIVIATTGTFTRPVETYAQRVSETTPFQVVLVKQDTLESYRSGGAMALRQRFRENAQQAMRLKRPQVMETLDELSEDEG